MSLEGSRSAREGISRGHLGVMKRVDISRRSWDSYPSAAERYELRATWSLGIRLSIVATASLQVRGSLY